MFTEARHDETLPPSTIPLVVFSREETALSALPFFSLDYTNPQRQFTLSYETKLTGSQMNASLRWQVVADPAYGFPDAFDRKVFKTLEYILLQSGLPLQSPSPFSLNQLIQFLGLPPFPTHLARVRAALRRIAATTVYSHITMIKGGQTAHQAQTFHLYDSLSFEEKETEPLRGRHEISLGAWYLENVNQRFVIPVDLPFFRLIRNPIASRLYELLALKFEDSFKRSLHGWRVSYTTLRQILPIKQTGWFTAPKRQLDAAHQELITAGFLERVTWEKLDREWLILYAPGPLAHKTHERFTQLQTGHIPESRLIPGPDGILEVLDTQTIPHTGLPARIGTDIVTPDVSMAPDVGTIPDEPLAEIPDLVPTPVTPTRLPLPPPDEDDTTLVYLPYWGLKDKPFDNTPNPRFYYETGGHQEALFKLRYVVNARLGAVLLTGDYGCGKTLLTRAFVHSLNPERYEIGLMTNPRWKGVELLQEILYQFGQESRSMDKATILRMLEDLWLRTCRAGRHTVLIVDEAQLIDDFESMEELRLLLNFQMDDRYLLTLVLVGQPELNAQINAIPQLEQRLVFRHHLTAMSESDTEDYILHRLNVVGVTQEIFTHDALVRIYTLTGGIPRRVNNLCDICLLLGYTQHLNIITDSTVNLASDMRNG